MIFDRLLLSEIQHFHFNLSLRTSFHPSLLLSLSLRPSIRPSVPHFVRQSVPLYLPSSLPPLLNTLYYNVFVCSIILYRCFLISVIFFNNSDCIGMFEGISGSNPSLL